MDKNRFYLDGPGETLIMDISFDASAATPNTDKIVAVITGKSASIRTSVTQENVTGGRSLSPRRKYVTERNITFEIEDCEMDFRYQVLTQGEDIVTAAATVWAFGENYRYTAAATLTLPATPLANTLVITGDDGTVYVKSATPAAGQYALSGAVLNFNAADVGKTVNTVFQFTSTPTTKTVSTKSTSVPDMVKIVHRQPMFNENNVITGYQEIEIFKAQVGGEFEEAYAEKQAFAPKLTFEVLDSARADKKLMDKKFIPV